MDKSSLATEGGATMVEMIVFTAIIVGSLASAILYLGNASQERIEKGQAVFSRHELHEPVASTGGGGTGGPASGGDSGIHPVVVEPSGGDDSGGVSDSGDANEDGEEEVD